MRKLEKNLLVPKALIVAVALVGTSMGPTEGASIKNGVNCSKANALIKVGKKSYRCAKNPYVKPERRTWTLTTCLTAYRLWQDAKSEYENWESLAKLAGAEGEKTLDDLQASIKSLEETMINQACKKGA